MRYIMSWRNLVGFASSLLCHCGTSGQPTPHVLNGSDSMGKPSTQGPPSNPTSSANVPDAVSTKIVLEVPISEVDGKIVHLDTLATPGRFRLVDCDAFLDRHILRVIEFSEFNPQPLRYAAVSYPWRDLQLPKGARPHEGCFHVHGAEHADPITVSVLRTACVASRHFEASLLWLDRLSMIQSSKEDKVWQIERMYTIYVHCNPCLVLPGGLVRLARPDEPTTWLDRAWTLQEAAASLGRDNVKCIYSFPYPSVDEFRQSFRTGPLGATNFIWFLSSQLDIVEGILEPGNSAFCGLNALFRDVNRTFSAFEDLKPELAKDLRNFPVRFISPPAARLETTRYTSHIRNHQYFWMSAFSRSSSRAVDMIFSIMAPLGVTLNVAEFQADDRLKATIKLIQATLRDGHPAHWLFTAPELPPSRELSLLPVFPETSVSGCAMLQTPQGRIPAFEAIANKEPWFDGDAPRGQMDDDGYFRFLTKAAPLAQGSQNHARATEADSDVWAVVVGRHEHFGNNRTVRTSSGQSSNGRTSIGQSLIGHNSSGWSSISQSPSRRISSNRTLGGQSSSGQSSSGQSSSSQSSSGRSSPAYFELTCMFVEKHGMDSRGELFHRVGMERGINEGDTMEWAWVEREFVVGGSGRGDRVRFVISESGPLYA